MILRKVKSFINKIIKRFKFRPVYKIIDARAKNTEDFFFIQIGSNDGKTGDPIYRFVKKYQWQGILVEPVNYLFQKLKDTYHNSKRLIFENVAIDEKDGYKTFYRIEQNNEPNNPYWYDQLGSFNKEVVLKHRNLVPNFDKHFISEQIPTASFTSLLQKHKVQRIDLLHIDTEGYDYNIIKLIPFSSLKPRMILYEHKHLNQTDEIGCQKFLEKQGYKIIKLPSDTFGYLS